MSLVTSQHFSVTEFKNLQNSALSDDLYLKLSLSTLVFLYPHPPRLEDNAGLAEVGMKGQEVQ